VDLHVAELGRRLHERRLTLDVTDAAKEWLAISGFDPAYGARPLRRLVQREIGDRLAKSILAGDISDGDTVLVDTADAGELSSDDVDALTGALSSGLSVRRKG
jgi:ATP-dependent Clp protease ATP-binding subunit ClpB